MDSTPTPAITAENFIDQLRAAFPEMEPSYHEEIRLLEGERPSPYNIAGFVFKPLLREELKRNELTDFLMRFSEFIERVCASGDVEAKNIVWLKFFKLLLGNPDYLDLMRPKLGRSTKSELRKAAVKWGLVTKLPSLF